MASHCKISNLFKWFCSWISNIITLNSCTNLFLLDVNFFFFVCTLKRTFKHWHFSHVCIYIPMNNTLKEDVKGILALYVLYVSMFFPLGFMSGIAQWASFVMLKIVDQLLFVMSTRHQSLFGCGGLLSKFFFSSFEIYFLYLLIKQ